MALFKKNKLPPSPKVAESDYGLLEIAEVKPQKEFAYNGNDNYIRKLWNIALDDVEKSRNTVTECGTVYSAGAY